MTTQTIFFNKIHILESLDTLEDQTGTVNNKLYYTFLL